MDSAAAISQMTGKWPRYEADEVEAVERVLRSGAVNYWTGEECRAFEREFAGVCRADYAIALANGTVALEAALRGLGVGSGDEVVVTSRSFVASASCVVNVGAVPVFADVCRDSGNLTAETVAQVLGPRVRGIVCVHLGGWPCGLSSLLDLANEHGLWVVEDCAQAHGACYRNRPVGGWGHVGTWSFCQDKIISTGGEGGMVTTSDEGLWERMWSYKDHGKSWHATYQKTHAPGYRWVHDTIGTNWRMLEIQAAIGRVQLRKLGDWRALRENNANQILEVARRTPGVRVPELPAGIEHAWYRCCIYVEPSVLRAGWSRDRIMMAINAKGVPCFTGPCPELYLEKAFEGSGTRSTERLPVARELGQTSLVFQVHPTLSSDEIARTCDAITATFRDAVA